MSWASHGSRGARDFLCIHPAQAPLLYAPHTCDTEDSTSIRTDSFQPNQPHAACRTSLLVRESRVVWSMEGTWEKPRRQATSC